MVRTQEPGTGLVLMIAVVVLISSGCAAPISFMSSQSSKIFGLGAERILLCSDTPPVRITGGIENTFYHHIDYGFRFFTKYRVANGLAFARNAGSKGVLVATITRRANFEIELTHLQLPSLASSSILRDLLQQEKIDWIVTVRFLRYSERKIMAGCSKDSVGGALV